VDKLIEGYRRFRATQWPKERDRFEHTADQGQSPKAMVIACSDSRVDPQMILGAGPGELFVVRNVANLVPPYEQDAAYHGTSAALEFGVRSLKVSELIVLGHGMCGGVHALLHGSHENGTTDFIDHWMQIAEPAKRATEGSPPDQRQKACEEATVRLSLLNLMTFPWVAEAVVGGRLSLHGAYFDIRHGQLLRLGPDGQFTPVAD
jgi:carbonic anhydrase